MITNLRKTIHYWENTTATGRMTHFVAIKSLTIIHVIGQAQRVLAIVERIYNQEVCFLEPEVNAIAWVLRC